jgi:hypothetical protein
MRPGVDRQTGDQVTGGERFSLLVQAVMRRWAFVLAYTALTITWWYRPHDFGDSSSLSHWQDWASYMALLIESVVGIGMFSWARRDSRVLRTVEDIVEKLDATLEAAVARDSAAQQRDEELIQLLRKVVNRESPSAG